jgi:hypothetical protein
MWFSQWQTKAALGEVTKRHVKLIVKHFDKTDVERARG